MVVNSHNSTGKPRILVAMSGGVDSSVAALLLKKQGYDVVGITMKTWDFSSTSHNGKETGCCNLDSFNDARMIAVENGFPHYILDLREEFGTSVVDNFVDEYLNGNTPNPCIMCNTHIKWNALFKKAKQLECEYIATGHYAHIVQDDDRWFIRKAKDSNKDQSYVLWGLNQEVLKKTLFPVSAYTKPEIRKMIADWGYDALAKKKDSYEICFIPNNDYHEFLQFKVKDFDTKIHSGNFVNRQGEIIGTHQGYPFYTVGQRKGLGNTFGKPMYVLAIDPEQNQVVLGEEDELQEMVAYVGKYNLQKIASLQAIKDKPVSVKIRYRDEGTLATLSPLGTHLIRIDFATPVKGLSPGQSAVFYDEYNDVLGGGIIMRKPTQTAIQ